MLDGREYRHEDVGTLIGWEVGWSSLESFFLTYCSRDYSGPAQGKEHAMNFNVYFARLKSRPVQKLTVNSEVTLCHSWATDLRSKPVTLIGVGSSRSVAPSAATALCASAESIKRKPFAPVSWREVIELNRISLFDNVQGKAKCLPPRRSFKSIPSKSALSPRKETSHRASLFPVCPYPWWRPHCRSRFPPRSRRDRSLQSRFYFERPLLIQPSRSAWAEWG